MSKKKSTPKTEEIKTVNEPITEVKAEEKESVQTDDELVKETTDENVVVDEPKSDKLVTEPVEKKEEAPDTVLKEEKKNTKEQPEEVKKDDHIDDEKNASGNENDIASNKDDAESKKQIDPKETKKTEPEATDTDGKYEEHEDSSETPDAANDTKVTDDAEEKNSDDNTTAKKLIKAVNKVYKCRYAQSINTKSIAVRRDITLYNMFNLFATNRTSFIGLVNVKDYDEIEKFMNNNDMKYEGEVILKETKNQFLTRLKTFTEYTQTRWN